MLLVAGAVYRAAVWANDRGKFDGLKDKWRGLREALGFEVGKEGEEREPEKTKARLKSLDTFRGITIALMIFVNDRAGG